MLNKFTVVQKFIFITVLLSFLILVLSGLNAYRLNTMAHHIATIKDADIPLTKNITAITTYQLEQEIYFEQAFRFAIEKTIN